MSFYRNWHDDFGCDFPGCQERFDTTARARVATIRSNDIVAFCHNHSARLIAAGVNLRVLGDVQRELNALNGRVSKEIPTLTAEEAKVQQECRERDFIASLNR